MGFDEPSTVTQIPPLRPRPQLLDPREVHEDPAVDAKEAHADRLPSNLVEAASRCSQPPAVGVEAEDAIDAADFVVREHQDSIVNRPDESAGSDRLGAEPSIRRVR
jgi:hypothetical protein